MDLKNLDLEVTIKDGKITAKVDSAGLKADVAVDLNAIKSSEGGGAPVIFQQLAAIAMGLGQGLQQAARLGQDDDDDDDGGDGGDEDEAEPPARKDAATATQ